MPLPLARDSIGFYRWPKPGVARFSIARIALLFGTLCGGASAAEEAPRPPEFQRLAPLPAIVQAAEAAKISLSGFAAAETRDSLRAGDSVTALVTVTEGSRLEQRILVLRGVELTAKEKQSPARKIRYFSSSGREFQFGSELAAMEVSMAGPLRAGDAGAKAATAPEIKRERLVVAGDYLALGLDRMPATVMRIRAARAANPTLQGSKLNIGTRPFSKEAIAATRPLAEAAGITEDDERALAGGVQALLEFFMLSANTPGLQDVLRSVLDIPWWSIVKSGGKMPDVGFTALPFDRELVAADWNLAASARVFASSFVLKLNGKPALLCQLAVTAPRPPLRVSAGIVGLAAGRPDGKGPVLTLQVVAARTAEDAVAK